MVMELPGIGATWALSPAGYVGVLSLLHSFPCEWVGKENPSVEGKAWGSGEEWIGFIRPLTSGGDPGKGGERSEGDKVERNPPGLHVPQWVRADLRWCRPVGLVTGS